MISIIIPTFNRSCSLDVTLASITQLETYGIDFEVIVIDNGSSDETREVCDRYRPLIKNFVYDYDSMPGLLTGRHKGMQLAKGGILAFIDDDVSLSPGWLSGIDDSFSNEDISLATGPCLPYYDTPPPGWLTYFWHVTPYGGNMCTWLSLLDIGPTKIQIDPNYVWGLNFCIRRNVLLTLGGFHPDNISPELQRYQGDGETGLTMKAAAAGLTAEYNPAIALYHQVSARRMTLEYFKKRAFYQGVCNSFADIKKNYSGNFRISESGFSPVDKIRNLASRVKRLLSKKNKNSLPANIIKMQQKIADATKEGYRFHQQAFANDKSVKEWVLKENYLEFNLPGK